MKTNTRFANRVTISKISGICSTNLEKLGLRCSIHTTLLGSHSEGRRKGYRVSVFGTNTYMYQGSDGDPRQGHFVAEAFDLELDALKSLSVAVIAKNVNLKKMAKENAEAPAKHQADLEKQAKAQAKAERDRLSKNLKARAKAGFKPRTVIIKDTKGTRLMVEDISGVGFGLGQVAKSDSGRKEIGGAMIPGPWAYAFRHAGIIDNFGGSGREIDEAKKAGLLVTARVGDILVIDGVRYSIEPCSKCFGNCCNHVEIINL